MSDAYEDFRAAVNMAPAELEKWLSSDESRAVGQKSSPGAESVGHDSGRKIVKLLRARKSELGEADEAHMRKVTGYVHRHLGQRPDGDVTESSWRYALMNWGHDPLRD